MLLGRLALGAAGVIVLAVALSAAAVAMTPQVPRGRLVEVEPGRRMRVVCEGPVGGPGVWMEAGAFGFAADWGSVQARLAGKGYRACAYDRAGLGLSDPGPKPRSADAVVADLAALMDRSGETGPYLMVGHSAGGLYLRRFSALHPERAAGFVLVDAMTPEGVLGPPMSDFARRFRTLARLAGWAATIGLYKPLFFTGVPDHIGLLEPVKTEKRKVFVSGRHNRGAAAEVEAWPEAIAQAGGSPPYDPKWPVAVVLAGDRDGPRAAFNRMRAAPAELSRRGRVEFVPGATHASLLGEAHADRIVAAVDFVAGR